ncbi:hypothetical protein DSO57_1012229 [Entomophthora muscae]|uniref:Uncharacterized protein n=1 Tax=Entomophthora muscae TaxID=34485 RepID=A0ACC2RKV7_9FUNG|nr:hypothetical protein DSO57_1012229 [Entomophthora muscae]
MGELFAVESQEYTVINWISICSALLVLFVCVWLRFVSNIRRSTLMLQAAVSFVDLIRHIRLLFNTVEDEKLCVGLAAVSFFGDHLSMLLNVAIAANLHCMFLRGKLPGALWHRLLWLLPIAITLVLDLLPVTMNVYGKVNNSLCFIRHDHPYRIFFKIYLLYASLYLGIIYCLVISTLVYLKALSHVLPWIDTRGPTFGDYNMVVLSFAMRIALYPLSCFISQVGFMAVTISFDLFGPPSSCMFSIALFLQSTTGIINLICLCFDPSVAVMARSCLASRKKKLHESVYSLKTDESSDIELPTELTCVNAPLEAQIGDACDLKLILDRF